MCVDVPSRRVICVYGISLHVVCVHASFTYLTILFFLFVLSISRTQAPLRITHTPLRITYTIPKFVLLRHRDPVFGWWDEARGQWQREGASCLNYDPELRQVELSLSCLKPFAIIQPRALDYPYREWSLTTLSTNSCLIKVRGSRFQIAFEVTAGAPGVPMQPGMPGGRYNSYGDRDNSSGQSEYQKKAYFKGGYVRLVEPNFPQLAHIFNKPMGPGELLMALSHSGINLLPADEDAIFSRKPLKTGILEQVSAAHPSIYSKH